MSGFIVARAALLALALSSCGDSQPTPPAKRTAIDDITNSVTGLFVGPKPKPAEQKPDRAWVIRSEPPPIAARPVEPVPQAAPVRTAKPKPKKEWQRKKAKAKTRVSGGVAGYDCATIRKAGSPAVVEAMAAARGYTVSDSDSRKIKACFNKDK